MPYFAIKHELAGLRTVRKRSHVRTHSKGDTCRELPLEFLTLYSYSGRFAIRGIGWRLREIFEDRERGNGGNILRLHDPHGLLAQLGRMIDGGDARTRRIKRSGLARRMHRNAGAQPRPLLDRALQFGLAVLIRRVQHSVDQVSGPVS